MDLKLAKDLDKLLDKFKSEIGVSRTFLIYRNEEDKENKDKKLLANLKLLEDEGLIEKMTNTNDTYKITSKGRLHSRFTDLVPKKNYWQKFKDFIAILGTISAIVLGILSDRKNEKITELESIIKIQKDSIITMSSAKSVEKSASDNAWNKNTKH